ncbi:MAG: hypothetical protein FWB99_10480 [Treponema sp.]|nr:hypothetical protein [Treponema sp.]
MRKSGVLGYAALPGKHLFQRDAERRQHANRNGIGGFVGGECRAVFIVN